MRIGYRMVSTRGQHPEAQHVVTKLDRLGRSLEHLIEISKQLQARGVDLVVLDQGIDTSTAVGGCSSTSSPPSPSSSTR
jgi:Resolvase, N terminal domain